MVASKYSELNAQVVVNELEKGGFQITAARMIGVHPDTILEWQRAHPDFEERVAKARIKGVTAYLERAKTELENAASRDEVLKCKERLNHARWEAEKLLPAFKSVTKIEAEHSGAVAVVGWMLEDPIDTSKIVDVTPGVTRDMTEMS